MHFVLAAHSHAYERSFLINVHYCTSYTFTESMKKHVVMRSSISPWSIKNPLSNPTQTRELFTWSREVPAKSTTVL